MTEAREMTVREEPQLSRPRLGYPARVEDIFGISRASWRFLTDVLYPTAEEPETIINVLAYCQARKLDVMKKPVHIVPVWDKKRKRMVDSVWPSIAEVRITAMRTGEYVGKGETVFGPDVTETLGGVEITYPKFAQLTVYRLVAGMAREFHGEKLLWKEFYAKAGRETLAPNDMWKTKPFKQLAKCAEADALRAAFPEEAGSDPTAEEMHGQEIEGAIASERVSGPNLQARLAGGASSSQGLDAVGLQSIDERPEAAPQKSDAKPSQAGVEEPAIDGVVEEITPIAQAEAPPAPSQQPPKARDEINGPAPAGVVYMLAGDPVSDAGRVPTYKDGEKHSNCGEKGAADLARYTMHPTKPSDEPEAEDDDGFPGDKPAPQASKTVEKNDTVAEDIAEEWVPLERHEGNAPRGVEYTLSDDVVEADDTVQAYEDGEPTRRVTLRDFVTLPEYDSHPLAFEDDGIGDVPDGPSLRDELAALPSWDAIKKELKPNYERPEFLALSIAEQEAVRETMWDAVGIMKQRTGDPVEPTNDLSAYRLWVTKVKTASDVPIMQEKFAVLRESPAGKKNPAMVERLADHIALIAKRLA